MKRVTPNGVYKKAAALIGKVIKVYSIVFFGFMASAGIVTFFSSLSAKPDPYVFVITILSGTVTFFLLRNLRKKNQKRGVSARQKNEVASPTAPTALTASEKPPAHKTLEQQRMPSPAPLQKEMVASASYQRIPPKILDLLWFSNGPFQNYFEKRANWEFDIAGQAFRIDGVLVTEPSAIDMDLPISSHLEAPSPLDYYPSYQNLSPEQRTAYLNWLCDITAPIDIGYVFIFYYGLERHLFFGKSEGALAAILLLRKFHQNNSFMAYSGDALMLYALMRNHSELMEKLSLSKMSIYLRLFAAVLTHNCLSVQDIIAAHNVFGFENNRYIKGEADLFFNTCKSLLLEQYHTQDFEITIDDLRKATGTFSLALANYSLLPSQRSLALPDISTSPRVRQSVHRLLSETHESVKIQLRELRKKQK